MTLQEAFAEQLKTLQPITLIGLENVKKRDTTRNFDNVSPNDNFGMLFYMEESEDFQKGIHNFGVENPLEPNVPNIKLEIKSIWSDQIEKLSERVEFIGMVGQGTTPKVRAKVV